MGHSLISSGTDAEEAGSKTKRDDREAAPFRPNGRSSSHLTARAEAGKRCFFDLPQEVRTRVYRLAGLTQCAPIQMNGYWGMYTRPSEAQHPQRPYADCSYYYKSWPGGFGGCQCPPLSLGLLYASRTISREALGLLYSTNRFHICRCRPGGLKPLANLSADSLAALALVTVQLSLCQYWNQLEHGAARPEEDACGGACDGDACCIPLRRRRCWGGSQPLKLDSPSDQAVLEDWRRLCERLAAIAKPSQLEIDFVGEVDDAAMAQAFLKPLSQLPRLRHCAIRLTPRHGAICLAPGHSSPVDTLRPLARAAVERAVGRPTPQLGPRRLPLEILHRIIALSDFTAPEVLSWTTCVDFPRGYLEPGTRCDFCLDERNRACFDPLEHAAAASRCTCWVPPVGLFRVDRACHREAMRHFFARNQFYMQEAPWNPVGRTHEGPQMLHFLSHLPPLARRSLRCLDWEINGLEDDFLPDIHSRTSWDATVDFMRAHLDLPALTLVLGFEDPHASTFGVWTGSVAQGPDGNIRVLYAPAIPTLGRHVAPVARLEGLKDLFVRFHPFGDTTCANSRLAPFLEKRVMGSEYDSVARGKFAPDSPVRKKRAWCDLYVKPVPEDFE